jgi:hypothetical protein
VAPKSVSKSVILGCPTFMISIVSDKKKISRGHYGGLAEGKAESA